MTVGPIEAFIGVEATQRHPLLRKSEVGALRPMLHSHLEDFGRTYLDPSFGAEVNIELALQTLSELRAGCELLAEPAFDWMFNQSSYRDVFEPWLQLTILQSYVGDPRQFTDVPVARLCVRTPELGRAEIFLHHTDEYIFVVVPREYIVWTGIYGWITAELLTQADRAGTPAFLQHIPNRLGYRRIVEYWLTSGGMQSSLLAFIELWLLESLKRDQPSPLSLFTRGSFARWLEQNLAEFLWIVDFEGPVLWSSAADYKLASSKWYGLSAAIFHELGHALEPARQAGAPASRSVHAEGMADSASTALLARWASHHLKSAQSHDPAEVFGVTAGLCLFLAAGHLLAFGDKMFAAARPAGKFYSEADVMFGGVIGYETDVLTVRMRFVAAGVLRRFGDEAFRRFVGLCAETSFLFGVVFKSLGDASRADLEQGQLQIEPITNQHVAEIWEDVRERWERYARDAVDAVAMNSW